MLRQARAAAVRHQARQLVTATELALYSTARRLHEAKRLLNHPVSHPPNGGRPTDRVRG
jgi:hypothetical protein